MNQTTLRQPFELSGTGLHTGKATRVRVSPAPAGAGYVLAAGPDADGVAIRPGLCDGAAHCNTVKLPDGHTVMVVEHLLAALAGMGVDNARIDVDGGEVPGGDGSAKLFADEIERAGMVELDAIATPFTPKTVFGVASDDGTSTVTIQPGGDRRALRITYAIDYPDAGLARGVASWTITPETFRTEVASARTFVLKAHADAMLAAGLGRGANAENTLVLEGAGAVGSEPRFRDECARHKVLDLLGDLATAGVRLAGAHVVSVRGGHGLNLRLAAEVARAAERARYPKGIKEIREIERILPHRYPFLLVDRVLEIEPRKRIVALKNITRNEPFFDGHFPGKPLMPGVLQVEALAQVAAVLFMGEPECAGKLAVIMTADGVKWRKPVVPGDQLLMEVEIEKFRSTGGIVRGRATVDGELAVEGSLKFALIPAND